MTNLYLRHRRCSGTCATTHVALLALALTCGASLGASAAEPIQAWDIDGWLDWNLADAVRELVGPQGAQVFPEWEREGDRVHLDAVLVMMTSSVDLGTVVEGRLGLHFDPGDLKLASVTIDLDEPIELAILEGHFGVAFELRYCKAAYYSILESPMIESSEEEATMSLAVLRSHRLVVAMPKVPGSVAWLEWFADDEGLEGC